MKSFKNVIFLSSFEHLSSAEEKGLFYYASFVNDNSLVDIAPNIFKKITINILEVMEKFRKLDSKVRDINKYPIVIVEEIKDTPDGHFGISCNLSGYYPDSRNIGLDEIKNLAQKNSISLSEISLKRKLSFGDKLMRKKETFSVWKLENSKNIENLIDFLFDLSFLTRPWKFSYIDKEIPDLKMQFPRGVALDSKKKSDFSLFISNNGISGRYYDISGGVSIPNSLKREIENAFHKAFEGTDIIHKANLDISFENLPQEWFEE